MSESKHTPGPWEYNDPAKFDIGYGKWSETAVYAPGNAFPWRMAEVQGPSLEVEIANARLIAAAPDLLEALKAMADYYGHGLANSEFPTEAANMRAAIAAIQKAEGH